MSLPHGLAITAASAMAVINAYASPIYEPCKATPPKLVRELRGAWIASVANIDWPSTSDLSTAEQKQELQQMLDRVDRLGLNAVFLQVRPSCDALYASSLEPWSEYLTGRMGKAPTPFYDPLEFAIKEAHQRGLELHAWFNPFRVRHGGAKSPPSPNHVSQTRPALVRHYGSSLWLDPGEPGAQEYSYQVVLDVVERYDIDGVHFDDYFYPYKEKDSNGEEIDFPDEPSWKRFGQSSHLSRDDWRRANVNRFVQRVYNGIKLRKPWVKFGVSPFGIWRPGNPPQIRGTDAYDKIYADSRLWLVNGWLDYLAPQLYWPIAQVDQSFPVLLEWWAAQNPKGRHVWAGMNDANLARSWQPKEIIDQVRIARGQKGVTGHIHYGLRRGLFQNAGSEQIFARDLYREPALVPAYPWLQGGRPEKPSLRVVLNQAGCTINWRPLLRGRAHLWLVQTRSNGVWRTELMPGAQSSKKLAVGFPDVITVSAMDRYGAISAPAALQLRR